MLHITKEVLRNRKPRLHLYSMDGAGCHMHPSTGTRSPCEAVLLHCLYQLFFESLLGSARLVQWWEVERTNPPSSAPSQLPQGGQTVNCPKSPKCQSFFSSQGAHCALCEKAAVFHHR